MDAEQMHSSLILPSHTLPLSVPSRNSTQLLFNQSSTFTDNAYVLIIAHRGASGLYPEHTREAYLAAIEMGKLDQSTLGATSRLLVVASHVMVF